MSIDPDEMYSWRRAMGQLRNATKEEKAESGPVEALSVIDWQEKIRLAHWYMRRAGLEIEPPVTVNITPPVLLPVAIILMLVGLIGLTTAFMR